MKTLIPGITVSLCHQFIFSPQTIQNEDYEEEMEEREPEVEPQFIDWCEGLDLPKWVAQADCDSRY